MRRVPYAHRSFGCKTIWQLKTTQLSWLVKMLAKEFKKPDKKPKGKPGDKVINFKRK